MEGKGGEFSKYEGFEVEAKDVRPESKEGKPERRYGCNVTIKNYWNRHAQKASGEVMAAEGGISLSQLSPKGEADAHNAGARIEASRHGTKEYASDSERTQQTALKMVEGYAKSNPDAPVRGLRVKEQLSIHCPEDFMALYEQKFIDQRRQVMEEMGLDPQEFRTLDADKQEEIAEKAEEPVLREWLSPKTELNKLYDPALAAGIFAQIFDRHHDRMAGHLLNDSKVDLIHTTHKGVMEPFLISGVLLRSRDGKQITDIEELGGAIALLEGWESDLDTDINGVSRIVIRLRGEEYVVDRTKLKELADRDYADEALHFNPSSLSDAEIITLVLDDPLSRSNGFLTNPNRAGGRPLREFAARAQDPERVASLEEELLAAAKERLIPIELWSVMAGINGEMTARALLENDKYEETRLQQLPDDKKFKKTLPPAYLRIGGAYAMTILNTKPADLMNIPLEATVNQCQAHLTIAAHLKDSAKFQSGLNTLARRDLASAEELLAKFKTESPDTFPEKQWEKIDKQMHTSHKEFLIYAEKLKKKK